MSKTFELIHNCTCRFDNSYPEPANNIETTSNPPQCNTGWRGEPDSEGSPNIKINSSAKYPTSSFHTSPARVHRPATGLKSPKGPSQLNMAFDLNFNQLPKYDFLLRKAQNRQNNQITPSTNIFLDTSSASLSVVAGNGGQSESTSLQDNPDIPLKGNYHDSASILLHTLLLASAYADGDRGPKTRASIRQHGSRGLQGRSIEG